MQAIDLTDAAWRTSSRSGGNGACVEVALLTGRVACRDSKNPDGGALVLTEQGWRHFLDTRVLR